MGWNGYRAEGMVGICFQLVLPRAGQPRASIQLRRGGHASVETLETSLETGPREPQLLQPPSKDQGGASLWAPSTFLREIAKCVW